MQQSAATSYSLEELQTLCDDCKLAIADQQDLAIKKQMETVCEKCKQVKEHMPELVELRKHLHEMNEELDAKQA